MSDDAELLRRYADEGAESAFVALVERHLDLVHSAAMRRLGGDAHLAQDVTQEVFTVLARKARTLRGHPVLSGWLYQTTRFAANRVMRTEQRRQIREQEAGIMQEILSDQTPESDWRQLRPVLDGVMDDLTAREREAVLLRFFEGRPFADVGHVLQLSEDGARTRVNRALEKMRQLLQQRGITSTTAALAGALTNQTVVAAPTGLAATVSGSALSAATIAVPGLGLISLMTAKKFAALMSVLGLVSIGIGIYEWQKAAQARAALAAASLRRTGAEQQLQDLQDRTGEEERTLADLQRQAAQPTPAPVAAPAPVLAPPVANRAEYERFAAAYPEVPGMLADYQKTMRGMQYRLFFLMAKLTPTQIDAFLNAFADVYVQSATLSPKSNFPEGQGNRPSDDQLRAILGEQALQQFKDIQKLADVTILLSAIQVAAGRAGAPLSPEQELQLAQVVLGRSLEYQSGKAVNLNTVDWTIITTEAQSLFTPAQWKAAQVAFLETQYNRRLRQAQREVTAKGK